MQKGKWDRWGLTDGGDGGDDLTDLELIEDVSFTDSVETDHEDLHLLLDEQPAEELPEREPHLLSASINHLRIKHTLRSLP
jgi:hypothetical protein